MDQATFLVRDLPAMGPGVKRMQLECSHGCTSGMLLAGRKPITDQVLLDLLRARHDAQNHCHCTTVLRPGAAELGSAAYARIPPAESQRSSATALERSDP